MILQTLDIKDNCRGIFHKDRFLFENFEPMLEEYSLAWKHSPILRDEDYRYLYLSLREEDLSSYSSDPDTYHTYKEKLRAHQNAAAIAKIDMRESCFFDIMPEHQLHRWFKVRQLALENLSKSAHLSTDYDILHKAHVLTTNISHQDVFFENKKKRVSYNIFGSATGRLTTNRGSVPVLTLKKDQRELITPQNDAFVELDLNAAEVRTLMALSGREQPQGDIHEWVVKNVFNDSIERSQAKIEPVSYTHLTLPTNREV